LSKSGGEDHNEDGKFKGAGKKNGSNDDGDAISAEFSQAQRWQTDALSRWLMRLLVEIIQWNRWQIASSRWIRGAQTLPQRTI